MSVSLNILNVVITLGLAFLLAKLAQMYGRLEGVRVMQDAWLEKVKEARKIGGPFDNESEAFWCGLNAADVILLEAASLAVKRLGLKVVRNEKKAVDLEDKDWK